MDTSALPNLPPVPVATGVLFAITAAGALLSGALPLGDGGDVSLFDGGSLYTVALVVPAVLLGFAAVTSRTSRAMVGLGGGVALATASLLGSLSIVLWKGTGGDSLGAGSYVMTATALVALVSAIVATAVPSDGRTNAGHVLGLIAAIAMSVGCTLVPSKYSDFTSWADWNTFGDGLDLYTFSSQLLIWMPVVGALIAFVKGGRLGALIGLGGSAILAWFLLAAALDEQGNRFSDFVSLSADVHPLAYFGAVGSLALFPVAAASSTPTNSSVAVRSEVRSVVVTVPPVHNPAQWSADPFGRHQLRYWDGASWSDNVADDGVSTFDPAVVAAPLVESPMPPASVVASPPPVSMSVLPAAVPVDDAMTIRRVESTVAPFAQLVLDSGQRIALVGPTVLGRSPRPHDLVPGATLLPVNDPSMSMSSTHLLLGPAVDGAWVEDVGSTNGSEVVSSAGIVTVLVPGVRIQVAAGSEIRFGDRSARLVTDERP